MTHMQQASRRQSKRDGELFTALILRPAATAAVAVAIAAPP
jgi:hypothetical protein